MKKILVVYYSQTGQLKNVIDSFVEPLNKSEEVEVTFEQLEPKNDYPFPWPFFKFFDTFPESVYLDPPEMNNYKVNEEQDFDLIILAYQTWFLSPSLPITAFLKSNQAKKLLKDKPVITLIGCRDMWIMGQEAMKELIQENQGILIDNVVLIDRSSSFSNFVTTPRWMLTGKTNKFLGIFPKPGINEKDIKETSRFGFALLEALKLNKEKEKKSLLKNLKAVKVKSNLILSEKIGKRSFKIWGKLLRLIGKPGNFFRRCVLIFYILFLGSLILTVVPLVSLLKLVFHPVLKRKLKKLKKYYEEPSGS